MINRLNGSERESQLTLRVDFEWIGAAEFAELLLGLRGYFFRSAIVYFMEFVRREVTEDDVRTIRVNLSDIFKSFQEFRNLKNPEYPIEIVTFARDYYDRRELIASRFWEEFYRELQPDKVDEWLGNEFRDADLAIRSVEVGSIELVMTVAYILMAFFPDVPYSMAKDFISVVFEKLRSQSTSKKTRTSIDAIPEILKSMSNDKRVKSFSLRSEYEVIDLKVVWDRTSSAIQLDPSAPQPRKSTKPKPNQ